MFDHPESYPQQVMRAKCLGINMMTNHVELEVDLGFDVHYRVCGQLANLSLPQMNELTPSEQHAHDAMQERFCALALEKPVLVIPHRQVAFKPMPPEYQFNVFFHQPDRHATWHSLEDQLVREGHAAWLDRTLPVPSVE